MNCPKCGSPLNPGDKFCQVCGSAVEQTGAAQTPPATPVAEQPVANPTPVASQPAVNATPVAPATTQEPKKGNTTVIVLVGIIAALVVAIVAILFLGKNNNSGSGNQGKKDPEPTPVVAPQYSEVTVGQYKLKLLPGYQAEAYTKGNGVYVFNDAETAEALIGYLDGDISYLNAECVLAELKKEGLEFTYKSETVEGKKALLFTGKINNKDYEIIYVQSTPTRVVYADMAYETSNAMASESNNLHKIVALTTIIDASSQNRTNSAGSLARTHFK